jgi:NAD+ synthase
MTQDEQVIQRAAPRPYLDFQVAEEVTRLSEGLRRDVLHRFRRKGAVVGCSGGVDSSVVLALCVRALGPERVLALVMPEKESSSESAGLAQGWARHLGVRCLTEDITAALEGTGAYGRRDEAIRRVFPDFGEGWKSRLTLPGSLLDDPALNVFALTVVNPAGEAFRQRLAPADLWQIIAASNFKQRTRMAMLYYHAEREQFVVAGTANRNEHALGFFVKFGDGGADLCPIQHLFKTHVYQLAEALDVPQSVRQREPTSDTYSAGSSQEEFFFRIPFSLLDPIWAGWERGVPVPEIAAAMSLTVEQVQRVTDDLARKRRTTEYLRAAPVVYSPSDSGAEA